MSKQLSIFGVQYAEPKEEKGLVVLSLFDGGSCGRLALQKAGIKVDKYYASEIEKAAIENTLRNFPDTIYLGDVNNWESWNIDIPDLIIGGSPCQGFSRQGLGLNFEDPRSSLFFTFDKLVKYYKNINPNLKFMLENVDMKKEWEDVISDCMGVQAVKINSDVFVPQNRPRTYWTNLRLPRLNNVEYSLLKYLDDVELLDYFVVDGIKVCSSFSENSRNLVSCIDGEIRIKQPVKLGYAVARPGDGVNLSFPTSKSRRGRVVSGRISCLDTSCSAAVLDNKNQIRPLIMNELERLQGMPEGYTKGMKESAAKKLIGNGWTVDVIAHIFGGLK